MLEEGLKPENSFSVLFLVVDIYFIGVLHRLLDTLRGGGQRGRRVERIAGRYFCPCWQEGGSV
jgi:hypothetical protein